VFVLMLFRLALFVCDRFLLPLFSPETLLFLLSFPRHLPISTFLAFAFYSLFRPAVLADPVPPNL
jgi:hypothetical protein